MTGPENSGEGQISDQELFDTVDALIRNWDYVNNKPEATALFSFNVSHWLLETYGQKNNKDIWYLETGSYDTDKEHVPGSELPAQLQSLVIHSWRDELYFHDSNAIRLRNQATYYEHESIVPKWEEIKRLKTYQEQLDMMMNDPEIRDHIVLPAVEILPEISTVIKPDFFLGWGLEFISDKYGVKVAPFGEAGKTWTAFDFASNYKDNQPVLSEIVCRLALLACDYCYYRHDRRSSYSMQQPETVLDTLARRLSGEEEVPRSLAEFQPNPGNAIKDLLISDVLKRTRDN